MNNSNYMIAVDENGQPYIAHAGLFSNLREKGAKYFQKIKTDYGTRYFYDKAEWDAYVKGQGAKPTSLLGKAKDKLGFDERARRNTAADKANNSNIFNRGSREKALNKAQSAYDQTALGRAENAVNKVRDTLGNTRNYAETTLGSIREGGLKKAQETISNAGKTISEASAKIQDGVKKLTDNAQATARKIGGTVQDVRDFAQAIADNIKAGDDFDKAIAKRDAVMAAATETVPGKIVTYGTVGLNVFLSKEYRDADRPVQDALDRIKDSCDRIDKTKVGQNLVKLDKSVRDSLDRMKGAVDDAKRALSEFDLGDAVRDAGNAVRNAANTAGDTVRNAASNVANRADSRDEKAALDEAQKAYDRVRGTGSDVELEAYWNLMNAQNAYNKTYGAQARNAASNIADRATSAATSARDTVNNLADHARTTASDAASRAREAASGAVETARNTATNAASRAGELAGQARDAVGNAASNVRDAVTGAASSTINKAREQAAEVADRTYAREAKAEFDKALREYEKVRGTGSDVELEAYWNMMNAQQALDRARGILG